MKHMRFAYCPLDGYVYGHGGDFTVLGDNEGFGGNSGRGETWRFNPRGSLARWERMVGYWGKVGSPQTVGSDERQIYWDGVIGKFWVWPSARYVAAAAPAGDPRWVGIQETREDHAPMLLFNPATAKYEPAPWAENRSALVEGTTSIQKKGGMIDEIGREIHQLRLSGGGGNYVVILNLTNGVWSEQALSWPSGVPGFGHGVQWEPIGWDPVNRCGYFFDMIRHELRRYFPATRSPERVMTSSELAAIPQGYMENEDCLLWNNDTGMVEYYRAHRTTTFPYRLWMIDPVAKRVWDGGDTWPDGTKRSAREWVYVPGVGSIGCGQAFAASSGVQNNVVGIGCVNEHWRRWVRQRNVASHLRVVPAGVGKPDIADASSPVSSTMIPFRAWGSPILDEATGDVYLFGSMHGDYMGNDMDVVNVAQVSNRQLKHIPPPERARQPHAGDPAYGGGGSAQAWYEGTGYAPYPGQGAPVSHWWAPYSIHAYGRNGFHPALGYLAIAAGVKSWNDPAPPTQQLGLLAYSKTGVSIGGGRTQRWTYVTDVPAEMMTGGAPATFANYAPDLGVVLVFVTPGSGDRTSIYEIRANGTIVLIRTVLGSWYSSLPGRAGGLHRYLGGGKFLNIAWGEGNSTFRTSIYNHFSGTFTDERTIANAPAEWAYFNIPNAEGNLMAAVDRDTQTIYWAQFINNNSIKVWSATVASPYSLTEIVPRPLGESSGLAIPNDAMALPSSGRGQFFFHGDSLWLFAKSAVNVPGNDDGSYQFWRMVVKV